MCTLILLYRPRHDWPVLIGTNRDEMIDRPWDPPGRHWPEHPDVVGGRDRLAGGTWLAVNGRGMVAAVLNRPGSLGPKLGRRSRGELPFFALAAKDAASGAAAVGEIEAKHWRRFNMVVADRAGVFFIRGLAAGTPQVTELEEGLYMITARDPNDMTSPRVAQYLPRFRLARPPAPPADWGEWPALLADRSGEIESQINITPQGGFGTVCSSLLAIAKTGEVVWRFAKGPPDRAPYEPVALAAEGVGA
jgi:hypothetical protein